MSWCNVKTNEYDRQDKTYPIICTHHKLHDNNENKFPVFLECICYGSCVCRWRHTPSYGVTVLLQVHDTYKNPERQTNTNFKINTLKQLQKPIRYIIMIRKDIHTFDTHSPIQHTSMHHTSMHQCIIQHTSHIHQHAPTLIFVHHSSISIHSSTFIIYSSTLIIRSSTFMHKHSSFIHIHASTLIIHSPTSMHQHSSHSISTHHTCIIPVKRHI